MFLPFYTSVSPRPDYGAGQFPGPRTASVLPSLGSKTSGQFPLRKLNAKTLCAHGTSRPFADENSEPGVTLEGEEKVHIYGPTKS